MGSRAETRQCPQEETQRSGQENNGLPCLDKAVLAQGGGGGGTENLALPSSAPLVVWLRAPTAIPPAAHPCSHFASWLAVALARRVGR